MNTCKCESSPTRTLREICSNSEPSHQPKQPNCSLINNSKNMHFPSKSNNDIAYYNDDEQITNEESIAASRCINRQNKVSHSFIHESSSVTSNYAEGGEIHSNGSVLNSSTETDISDKKKLQFLEKILNELGVEVDYAHMKWNAYKMKEKCMEQRKLIRGLSAKIKQVVSDAQAHIESIRQTHSEEISKMRALYNDKPKNAKPMKAEELDVH